MQPPAPAQEFAALASRIPDAALRPFCDLLTAIRDDRDAPGDLDAAVEAVQAVRRVSPALRPVVARIIAAKFTS